MSRYPKTPGVCIADQKRSDVGESTSDESLEEERKRVNEITPLLFASMKGEMDLVLDRLLVDGLDVNQSQGDGWTALHYSVNSSHQDVINLLAVWWVLPA